MRKDSINLKKKNNNSNESITRNTLDFYEGAPQVNGKIRNNTE